MKWLGRAQPGRSAHLVAKLDGSSSTSWRCWLAVAVAAAPGAAFTTRADCYLRRSIGVGVGNCLCVGARMGGRQTVAMMRWFAIGYVELIRNTPFIVQLFFIFFGLPTLGVRLTPEPRLGDNCNGG